MSKTLYVFATLLMIAALAPATATADPLVITSGTLSVAGLSGGPSFNLTGLNFAVSGGGEQGSSQPQMSCTPCVSGATVGVGGFFAGSSVFHSATIDGTFYPNIGLGGTFILSGPPVTGPNSTANRMVRRGAWIGASTAEAGSTLATSHPVRGILADSR